MEVVYLNMCSVAYVSLLALQQSTYIFETRCVFVVPYLGNIFARKKLLYEYEEFAGHGSSVSKLTGFMHIVFHRKCHWFHRVLRIFWAVLRSCLCCR